MECCSCHKAFHRGCCLGAPKSGDSHVTSSKWRCTQCVKCATCGKTASTDVSSANTLPTTADEFSFLSCSISHYNLAYFPLSSPPISSPPLPPPLPSLPLQDQPALWYDAFTCCADCNQLRNKGNFCPVCKEAYTDSDYESKMVQCAGCFHWVHAHCEDMTGESPALSV